MTFMSKASTGIALSLVLAAPAMSFPVQLHTEPAERSVEKTVDRFVAPPEPRIKFEQPAWNESAAPPVVMDATSWAQYWNSDECHDALAEEWTKGTSLYCGTPHLMYSRQYNLAYMETPKAGIKDIEQMFLSTFQDATFCSLSDLSDDAFVFTFVRDPLAQKIATFAEAEKKSAASSTLLGQVAQERHPAFLDVDPMINSGADRFLVFLQDLEEGKFDDEFRSWTSFHAGAQLQVPCESGSKDTLIKSLPLSFIGHVENAAADWALLQDLAKVPMEMRTDAVTINPVGEFSDFIYTRALEVQRSDTVTQRICNLFKSDYACLAYEKPASCEGSGYVNGPSEAPPQAQLKAKAQ